MAALIGRNAMPVYGRQPCPSRQRQHRPCIGAAASRHVMTVTDTMTFLYLDTRVADLGVRQGSVS